MRAYGAPSAQHTCHEGVLGNEAVAGVYNRLFGIRQALKLDHGEIGWG